MSKELVMFTNGVQVRTDKQGNICLTDLWKSAGSKREQAPNFWTNQDSTQQLIETVGNILNATTDCIIKSKRGKGGGTYAHKQIALAYAKYLSPELHYAVNQVFFERLEEEKNPQLAVDRAVSSWKKQGKDESWIGERLLGTSTRSTFTSILAHHKVKGVGFRDCTNAIYTPLFGGGADVVRAKKQLPEKANTREHMTEMELAAVRLAELMASDNIKRKGLKGNKPCEYECLYTSRLVANAVMENNKRLKTQAA